MQHKQKTKGIHSQHVRIPKARVIYVKGTRDPTFSQEKSYINNTPGYQNVSTSWNGHIERDRSPN